jgi:hypothetical protein
VAAEWPGPITLVGDDIGQAVLFPAASIEKDFAWSKDHPVVDAYRAFLPMPYDAPTHALAGVLCAVRPQRNYFTLSAPGRLEVLDNGKIALRPDPQGQHRQASLHPEKTAGLLATYVELASAKPVPRVSRFRPPAAEQKKVDPPKPIEKKP